MNHSMTLQCTDLSFAYGTANTVNNLSFECKTGEFIGLIGPNGAGKSSLLQLLLGILPPDTGEVLLNGSSLDLMSREAIAQSISFVPQDHAIEYSFTVEEMVAMGRTPYLGRYDVETKNDLEIIEKALQLTDLIHLKDRPADQLSGGERQRVFVARALAQETDLLLLDEPTSNLDLSHQLELMTLVKSITTVGKTAIAAIHDLELASRFCDRLLLLSAGQLVADGRPEEVLTETNLQRYFSIIANVTKTESNGLKITALQAVKSGKTQ